MSVDDPVLLLHELEALASQVRNSVEELSAASPEAVTRLRRRGWSYAKIAEETTLPRERVVQLARDGRTRKP